MRKIQSVTHIRAQPEIVWDILTDFDHYPNWNPFITALSGQLHPGAQLRATFHLANRKPRTFTPTLTIVEPHHHLQWHGHLAIPKLLDAHHTFHLEPTPTGTKFTHQETFHGALLPLLGPTITATHHAIADMDTALTNLAEACQGDPDPLPELDCVAAWR